MSVPQGAEAAQEDAALEQRAREEAERVAMGQAANFLGRVASVFGGQTWVNAVFGAPVGGPGATVVPVARVRFLMGGGLGQGGEGLQVGEGGGGGGAVSAVPVGYIEITDGTSVFRPIRRSPTELLRPTALVLAVVLLRRVVRLLSRSREG